MVGKRSIQQRRHFGLVGNGSMGREAVFDVQQTTPSGAPVGPVLLRITFQNGPGPGQREVTVLHNRHQVLWVRASSTMTRRLKVVKSESLSQQEMAAFRDREFGLLLLCAFHGRRYERILDDAVNAFTFHLARAAGENVKTVSEVWVNSPRDYQIEAHRILGSLGEEMRAALAAPIVVATDKSVGAPGSTAPTITVNGGPTAP